MILLVRHGETQWNVERRMQGQKDSPLTERGRRQAQAMAALVAGIVRREAGDWRLVASPLGRAQATAAMIAEAAGLNLDVPQDAVYRLQNGQIDRFDCEPVE